MLILAREYRGFTQGQLAQRASLSQPKVARIENGINADVDSDELARLVDALSFPLDFFMQDEVRVGFGSSSYYYRKKAALSAADRKRIQSIVNILRIHLKRMLGAVDVNFGRSLRKLDLDDYSGKPELVARAIRSFWKLPEGPIVNLTELVESAGVIVVPCDFGTREMDGTGFWLGELPPIIFLRSDLPGDRWRFTLAHELGHLVMHDVPLETMEREADQFAAELLMPESDIRPQLARFPRIAINDLANLKPYWRVAMQSILRRSLDLGYTTENQARYLYQRMGAMGFRTQEPVEIERETPKIVQRLLGCFTDSMGYDAESLAAFLRVSPKEMESLYQVKFRQNKVEKPKLRIVN